MTIKTKRRLCEAAGWLCWLGALIIIGGMDMGWMPVGRGAVLAVVCELVGAAALWKGGVIRLG